MWKEYRQVDILCTFRMGGGFTLYYRRAYDDGAFSVYIQTRLVDAHAPELCHTRSPMYQFGHKFLHYRRLPTGNYWVLIC